ncbi:hypothetical protein RR48_03878 [Papilio machaon]|uniref:Centromere/kinetochore protein zw10-like n=1 Tax=Papilio machaon TaxID=76193 RepID=A0A0N0PDY2_PAPMA|nr:hypothetical protein RR48_03878 [Papilio machaon]
MSSISSALHEADKAIKENVKKQREEMMPILKDLIERVQLFSWALQQNFIDTFCNFTPTKSLEELNYKNRKSNILADYNKLLEDVKLVYEKSATLNEEFSTSVKKLENAMKVFNNLCIVVEGKQILDKASHEFGRYNYIDAMVSVKDLRKQLASLKFEGNAGKALSKLNDQAENQLAMYAAQLSIEWEDIFNWEEKKKSTKLPEEYSRQLVMYIRDIAVMYQCLIPKKFRVNLECCPLDIALFFNNCFYLAHSLIGPPWKNILPSFLADLLTTVLLECIQDLRVVGLEKISIYLQTQRNVIVRKIEETELPWTHDSYQTFDAAIKSSLSLMEDLKSSWFNVLPIRMYELSMCTLAQALCQAMLDRIFADSKPISEELVYMLAVRFEDTMAEIKSLFDEEVELDNKINIWVKFSKMPQILKAQLLEITDLWRTDKLLLQCYACEEIRQIVKLRFPDDKYRLKILKEIQ